MTAQERIDQLIAKNAEEIAEVAREHGFKHGQALCIEFNERRRGFLLEPDHIVHISTSVYLTREARRIGHHFWRTFLRARYASKPDQAPAICFYMPRPGDVAAAIIILDLQNGAKWQKLTQIGEPK